MNINLDHVDWDMLREQKETLLEVLNFAENGGMPKTTEHLTGILHLLDYLQDEAANCIGEKKVFG